MIFERQGKPAQNAPTPSQVAKGLQTLRSYRAPSFASLTDSVGNYVQVGGGGTTCMLELYRTDSKERFRGYSDFTDKIRPDGTILSFGAGDIPLMADEWFTVDAVIEVFQAFLAQRDLPATVHWRRAPVLAGES